MSSQKFSEFNLKLNKFQSLTQIFPGYYKIKGSGIKLIVLTYAEEPVCFLDESSRFLKFIEVIDLLPTKAVDEFIFNLDIINYSRVIEIG